VPQSSYFCVKNALKLTYKHLQVKKIFPGAKSPDPQNRGGTLLGKERGRGGEGREGKGREGKGREREERGGKDLIDPQYNLIKQRP
jgi:hypothetical protein